MERNTEAAIAARDLHSRCFVADAHFDLLPFVLGMAIAYFLSAWFRTLPAFTATHRSQLLVEGVSVFALTVTVAVFWEFAEFLLDQTVGSNLQVSLANTMKDLAMGVSGAAVVTAWRVRGLRPHAAALRASAAAWVRGEMA